MFDGEKYITSGITKTIPLYLQNVLWYLIENMPEGKSYLQVFELSELVEDGCIKQKIKHIQENPEYVSENTFSVRNPINAKIYVIDDCSCCTMLLAEEY